MYTERGNKSGKYLATGLLLAASQADAAGGHHLVDDATLLGTDECYLENWAEAHRGGELLHVAPACRLGPAEYELAFDYDRTGPVVERLVTPQIKTLLTPRDRNLRVGLIAGSGFALDSGYAESHVFVPVTYSAGDSLEFHANLGHALERGNGSNWTWGLAVQPAISDHLSAVGEVVQAAGRERILQFGLRYELLPEALELDVSVARRFSNERTYFATLGLNWIFSRH